MSATIDALNTEALAQACACHPETVRRAIRRGEIQPARTFGRSYVFEPATVPIMRGLLRKARSVETHEPLTILD